MTQWHNTSCPNNAETEIIHPRRCLGSRPDICVEASCKYILLKII